VPGATTVELYAGELLTASICCRPAQTTLHLPLDVGSVDLAADAIASAVADVAGSQGGSPADPAAQARELLLRARLVMQGSLAEAPRALALLEQAHALCPDDARIAATLAILCTRFVVTGHGGADFTRPRALARAVLAVAPELAESHLAAGHLELHTGDPAAAAAHFRTAIARSPHTAEAHEALGRMLIEAGFLDVAMARLQDALAIAPHLISARWEIARAYALEEDWVAYDAQEALLARHHDRVLAGTSIVRMRIAWWRRDLLALAAAYDELGEGRMFFDQTLLPQFHAVVFEGGWPALRESILAHVLGSSSPSLRRNAFLAQIGAELAGYAGDVDACIQMIERAVACGLYDLHWLDRCPLLEPARGTLEIDAARALVKARAESILDALYGDVEARSDTLIG